MKKTTEQLYIKQCKRMPLMHGSNPEEVASIVKTILNTPSMTGQIITLDGGQHLGWSQTKNKKHIED